MALNLVPFANEGVKATLAKMSLAVLKIRKHVSVEGQPNSVTVTLAVMRDNNSYSKSNGELVKEPNLGETFNVHIVGNNCPTAHSVINNVKLVNPIIHAVYATSAEQSTFAQMHVSFSANALQMPEQFNNKERSNR